MDITPCTRTKILTLYNYTNKSITEISKIVGHSKSSVYRIITKSIETGSIEGNRKSNCGRKSKASAEQIQMIITKSEMNPRITSSELRNYLSSLGIEVTSRTIRRYLFNAGRIARRPLKKQILTEKMKQARLQWAEDHKDWTQQQWRQVLFSDESYFQCQGHRSQYVRRSKDEEITEQHINQYVKAAEKRMFWGSMSYAGVGSLCPIQGTMNADKYMDIINSKIKSDMEEAFGNMEGIYQQDLAPCHRAKKVKALFSQKQILILDWPGNSPDLSPIENLWAIIKRKQQKTDCRTLEKMTTAVINIWCNDPSLNQHCKKLVDSMPQRVMEVIRKKGGHIKY